MIPHVNALLTYDEAEAAMCLWEESIRRQGIRDDDLFKWLAGGEGAASARDMCLQLAKDVEHSYLVAKLHGFDACFDWDFVPQWANLAMEITMTNELTPSWCNYIGWKIAEWEKERWS